VFYRVPPAAAKGARSIAPRVLHGTPTGVSSLILNFAFSLFNWPFSSSFNSRRQPAIALAKAGQLSTARIDLMPFSCFVKSSLTDSRYAIIQPGPNLRRNPYCIKKVGGRGFHRSRAAATVIGVTCRTLGPQGGGCPHVPVSYNRNLSARLCSPPIPLWSPQTWLHFAE
jgi:hypothetical protein